MTLRTMARAAVGATPCATLAAVTPHIVAQERIDKPVKLRLGFPPGGTGMDTTTGTPEEFGRIVASDYARWGPIVTASGFKPL